MPLDTNGEALAMLLYSIYWEAIGDDHWGWDDLQPNEHEAWVQVAQWVIANLVSQDDNEPDHK